MTTISAALIKELRESTGAGFLDCKKALSETHGDIDKAITYLRENGVVKAAKKADRAAAEGLVSLYRTSHSVILAEVNCETDFVARNEKFQTLSKDIAQLANSQHLAHGKEVTTDTINEWIHPSSQTAISSTIQTLIAEIGENIRARRVIALNSGEVFGGYIHSTGTLGAIVSLSSSTGNSPEMENLAKDIAMHITAAAPLALSRDSVPAEKVEAERAIFMHQILEEGKPAQMAEKIVLGKLNKFFAESCLLEQAFIKDPDTTITNLLKKAGGTVTITGFARFKVGEGIEKAQSNFADEVASMVR